MQVHHAELGTVTQLSKLRLPHWAQLSAITEFLGKSSYKAQDIRPIEQCKSTLLSNHLHQVDYIPPAD
jgi:hypothetical protein